MMIQKLRRSSDTWAILLLIGLWGIFFWRLYTPNEVDQVSLQEGDFSGQFVAWTSYSVERFREGEIPLWNPYMNAGAPFLADPQTAVLYPPRLLTVALLARHDDVTNGDVYAALQREMTLQVLLGVLLMYAFLRRLTRDISKDADTQISVIASVIGALVFGFGGFMSAYPPLQLPLLEAAIWIPLVLLGIHEATRLTHAKIGWRCLVLAGVALALCALAGHPQTLLFTAYVASAYLIYRLQWGTAWKKIGLALLVLALVAGGLAAVQLLPTAQFQSHTYRENLSVDDKGGGFSMQDFTQFVFPYMLGRWTPLYLGLIGLVLVGIAIWRRVPGYAFWLGVGLFGLALSFGQRLAIYDFVYVLLPGFGFFRGQERAAFVIAVAGSVLASMGAVQILTWDYLSDHKPLRQLRRVLIGLIIGCALFGLIFFVLRLIPPNGELYQGALDSAGVALVVAVLTILILPAVMQQPTQRKWQIAIIVLVVFDLFSANMGGENYDPIPANDRLPEPAFIQTMRDNLSPGQKIEGLVGIGSSYSTLYDLPDIWGNSPLQFEAVEFYLQKIPVERRWELLAVQVLNAEWDTLPVPATRIGEGPNLHVYRLDNPRPFAHMVYQVRVVTNNGEARQLVGDQSFPLRDVVVLKENPGPLPENLGNTVVALQTLDPEKIRIQTQGDTAGVLTLALPYDTGWHVKIDGKEADLLEAYGGLSAVYVSEGAHQIELTYRPLSIQIGAVISGMTLLAVLGVIGWGLHGNRKIGVQDAGKPAAEN
ncbi:MAG: YfhO family protein [Chloroflexi bacterium]|nr:YfhO family protein [Chloroflexota bacterium]